MSTTRHTTRHHLNRQRRLAAVPAPERTEPPAPVRTPVRERPAKAEAKAEGKAEAEGRRAAAAAATRRVPRVPRLFVVLCALTLLLGAFAGWAFSRAQSLHDGAALQNTALSDPARTSKVKGEAERAVNALFSYDQADPGASEKAADRLLTGKAVEQHRTLLAPVLAQAKKQKTVVTTTVTDSAVERIDGHRARVLVFADQSSAGTAAKADAAAAYAGAMLAVDLVEKGGTWRVSGIDTFGS
ncbi:hypothetical protein GTW43_16425 [Streptomyces sp. SID5785]|uniref:hypothetical protein n=1 Tax=Streptomyces sp. SID5785 TaxID=2690309 RepID=UPI001360BC8B|nr:hypothetical protein [Streptomyces sp. SID5785]MZD06671.1 hypothetical protein [Streptomyces sp. SID5785]